MVVNEISVVVIDDVVMVSENNGVFEAHQRKPEDVVAFFENRNYIVYLHESKKEALEHHKRISGINSKAYRSLESYVVKQIPSMHVRSNN